MAGVLKINPGTKLRMAFDVPIGQEPKFNMICTFNKSLDESAFLVSIPMVGGKALEPDENQKLLFEYGDGEEAGIIAGYVDDTVKVGIRRFWKVRRVTEHRQFIKRVDVRMKVALPVKYMQDTWALNSDGEIDQELGETMDISNGGLAIYMNRWFDVGETCIFTLPSEKDLGRNCRKRPVRILKRACSHRKRPDRRRHEAWKRNGRGAS